MTETSAASGKSRRLRPSELKKQRRAAKEQQAGAVAEVDGTKELATVEREQEPEVLKNNEKVAKRTDGDATTAFSKLSSFYNRSAIGKKRQKTNHQRTRDMPSTFQVEDVPLDLTPKKRLVIVSSFQLPFSRPTVQSRKRALASFASTADNAILPPDVRWQRALHYYMHPSSPLPPSVLSNTSSHRERSKGQSKETQAYLSQRFQTWQESFHDAYMCFRKLTCGSMFYIRSNEYTICFYQNPVHASRQSIVRLHDDSTTGDIKEDTTQDDAFQTCAVMSQSNAHVRKALQQLNVPFTVPFDASFSHRNAMNDLQTLEKELVELGTTTSSSHQPQVHGPNSLLYFRGHAAVHGLYEFLLNRKPPSNHDVPQIFTRHPFMNASLQQLDVLSIGRMASSDEEEHFRCEITGFVFPSALQDVVKILGEQVAQHYVSPLDATEEATMVVRMLAESCSDVERFNVLSLPTAVIFSKQVALSMDERDRVRHLLADAKRRIDIIALFSKTNKMEIQTTNRVSK